MVVASSTLQSGTGCGIPFSVLSAVFNCRAQTVGPDIGAQTVGPDIGAQTVGPDIGAQTVGPDIGAQTVGPDIGAQTVGPDIGTLFIQLCIFLVHADTAAGIYY